MKRYCIKEEVGKLKTDQSKVYHCSYAETGIELGFGKRGKYQGHSHLFFYDVIFSFGSIMATDADNNLISGNLLIIPPRTFLGDVIIEDFFFMKFCPSKDIVVLPDKIGDILREGDIQFHSNNVVIELPWHKNHSSKLDNIRLTYVTNKIFLQIGSNSKFSIE